MSGYKGIQAMRELLNKKKTRVELRYKFYEMKNTTQDLGISTPPGLESWNSVVGWCAKAVDSVADRLKFNTFREDAFDINGVYQMNNADILIPSAVLSACISSCCFIYISADETGYPRMQVIDGANATGRVNPVTWLLEEGYAVLERDKNTGNAVTEAYFTKEYTEIITKTGTRRITNNTGYPLLVPIIHRPDAKRAFGHSVISRACMSLTGSALRTIKRSEIGAEFYSFPQKYVLGTDPNADRLNKWRASMSSLLEITKDEDGEKPTVGQFTQQSMQPHLEQLKMFAGLFSGETGLTLDDMGFPGANPASNEAIKAAHENLRLKVEKAQECFGVGLLNAGFVAACMRDDFAYQRRQMYMTRPVWRPAFALDASQLSGLGDAVIKIAQSFPEYFTDEKLEDLTGI